MRHIKFLSYFGLKEKNSNKWIQKRRRLLFSARKPRRNIAKNKKIHSRKNELRNFKWDRLLLRLLCLSLHCSRCRAATIPWITYCFRWMCWTWVCVCVCDVANADGYFVCFQSIFIILFIRPIWIVQTDPGLSLLLLLLLLSLECTPNRRMNTVSTTSTICLPFNLFPNEECRRKKKMTLFVRFIFTYVKVLNSSQIQMATAFAERAKVNSSVSVCVRLVWSHFFLLALVPFP